MLAKQLERRFPGAITDVVLEPPSAFVALGTSLAIFDLGQGQITRCLPAPVHALVRGTDGAGLLAVSPILPAVPPPWWSLRASQEENAHWRRISRLAGPSAALEDLGEVKADGFSATWDGTYFPTYDGDTVYLFQWRGSGLAAEGLHETHLPGSIALLPQGVWLETSSLAGEHFELLAPPDLRLLARGDLEPCELQCPPERIHLSVQSPAVSQGIFVVRAAAVPRDDIWGEIETSAVRGVHRIATLDNRVVARLARPALGLVAAGDRALAWAPAATGLHFLYIALGAAQTIDRFSLAGATQAGARFFGRDLAVWADDTLHLYRETDD